MQHNMGLDSLKFARTDLLAKVKANREKHVTEYATAMKEYRRDMIEFLAGKLSEAKEEQDVPHHINLIRPTEYTKHYDRAIAMLQMTVNTEIELEQAIFAQLVLDEWSWSESFLNGTSTYLNKRK